MGQRPLRAWEGPVGLQKTLGESFTKNEMALIAAYREVAPNEEIEVDRVVAFRVQEALKGTQVPKGAKKGFKGA